MLEGKEEGLIRNGGGHGGPQSLQSWQPQLDHSHGVRSRLSLATVSRRGCRAQSLTGLGSLGSYLLQSFSLPTWHHRDFQSWSSPAWRCFCCYSRPGVCRLWNPWSSCVAQFCWNWTRWLCDLRHFGVRIKIGEEVDGGVAGFRASRPVQGRIRALDNTCHLVLKQTWFFSSAQGI